MVTSRDREIIDRYRNDKLSTCRSLGREFGLSLQRIHQILRKNNVVMRPIGAPPGSNNKG